MRDYIIGAIMLIVITIILIVEAIRMYKASKKLPAPKVEIVEENIEIEKITPPNLDDLFFKILKKLKISFNPYNLKNRILLSEYQFFIYSIAYITSLTGEISENTTNNENKIYEDIKINNYFEKIYNLTYDKMNNEYTDFIDCSIDKEHFREILINRIELYLKVKDFEEFSKKFTQMYLLETTNKSFSTGCFFDFYSYGDIPINFIDSHAIDLILPNIIQSEEFLKIINYYCEQIKNWA